MRSLSCWLLLLAMALIGGSGAASAQTKKKVVSHASTGSTQFSPPFRQCPPVGVSPTCSILIVVGANNSVTVLQDPNVGPYDDSDDTLVGIVNNTTQPISSLPLVGNTDIFGFDQDGMCSGYSPQPSGCPFGPTGYEGPGTSFSNISPDGMSGVINFNPPLQPGASAYVSLEEALDSQSFINGVIGSPSALTFTSPVGGPAQTQTLQVIGSGGNIAFAASATVNTPAGAKWLQVTTLTGTGSVGNLQSPATLNVVVTPGTLPPGTYSGYIALDADNDFPTIVPVTLTVTGAAASNPLSLQTSCPGPTGPGAQYDLPIVVSGGTAPYSIRVVGNLPPGISLVNGRLTGTVPVTVGTYGISLLITDSTGQSIPFNCSVVVRPFPVVLSGGCPVDGRQGSPYSFTFSAVGGDGTYSFGASGLPAGLSLRGDTISGTITAAPGAYPVTVTASGGGTSDVRSCVLNVLAPALTLTSACPTASVAQGASVSVPLAATGGNGVFTYSIVNGSLPGGLTLSGNQISGTVTAGPGTYPFAIMVSSGGQTVVVTCGIVVTAPVLSLTASCPAGTGTVNVPYGPFSLTATGGTGTYGFSVTNGSLPAGVSLNGTVISGTPTTPGTSTFRITATSGTQTANSAACTVVISAPPIQLTGPGGSTTPAPITATPGTSTSVTLTASGGLAPYTFSLNGPPWLSLVVNGNTATVTGTPPAPGTYQFSITVTDSAGNSTTTNYTITATAPPLTLTGVCPTGNITLGNAFSLPLTGGGGFGQYSYTLSGPSFLSLSSASGGTTSVTGTPNAAGTYSFTVTIRDTSNSTPVTYTCSLTVVPTPLQLTASGGGCPTASLTLPGTFSVGFSAAGGVSPYTFAYSGPSFLSLSSTTGTSTTLSGTPTAGAYNFTVTLSDSAGTQPATFSCGLQVNPAVVPPQTVSANVPSSILNPATLTLSLAGPTPVPLTGTATITFTSNAAVSGDNPQVQFLNSAATSNGRVFTFTIPAGGSSVTLPSIQQGTVAGTIHVEITSLLDGTRSVLTTPHPSADVTVAPAVPVITGASFTNETSTGFNIVINGYTTTRDLTTVNLTFTPRSGMTLDGPSTFNVDVHSVIQTYFQSAAAQSAGGTFANLSIPITISGDKNAIGSVTITLTNGAGTSAQTVVTR